MTTTTTDMTTEAIAKARRRIEALLEANGKRLHDNDRAVVVSMDERVALKGERVVLLRLLAQHGGDPEMFEMEGATVEGMGMVS